MHIYYIIHYFPPELNGGATRASELADLWSSLGHEITVLTGFPNHPSGIVPKVYKRKLFKKEAVDGYSIQRSFVYATPNKGFAKRILNHISLAVSSIMGSFFLGRPQVIIASSPPLFLGISGYVISRLKGVPYVFEVRDIWPQQAIDLGMLSNQYVIRAMEALEFFLYKNAAKVIGVTESTRRILIRRGLEPNKIAVVFNGTDVEKFDSDATIDTIRDELGVRDKFLISYIGTIGLSQGLDTLMKSAQKIQSIQSDICFLLVGDGAQRSALIQMQKDLGLHNVFFVDPQPRSRVPHFYGISDITVVPLRDVPLFRTTIPSKIFEIMSCGTPMILAVRGEAARIVEESGGGMCIEPENVDAMVEAILDMRNKPSVRDQMSINAREYVHEHYNRKVLAQQYISILEEVANKE